MKSSTSFRFSSLLFFFIVVSMVVYSEAGCAYYFIVKTGTVADAGTDSLISVTLGNTAGESLEILDLKKWGNMPPGHYFKNGNLDYFSDSADCFPSVGEPLCEITVTSDGSGQNPGWFLEYVEVTILDLRYSDSTKIKFEFSQWLANDEPPYELTASRNECESSTSF